MEACYGGTDVMERSCAVARGIDINTCVLRSLWCLSRPPRVSSGALGVNVSWVLK
jgi:hypothetical protein